MNLKEYIDNLKEFANKNPECLEMQVVYSKDDEGNGYNTVNYNPSKGNYDENFKDFHTEEISKEDINAICIN